MTGIADFALLAVAAPLRRQIEDKLRVAIIDGKFQPGKRLVERELCALFSVSRTSVREALRQLEAEGLVKVIPYKGPVVAGLSINDARQIYQVREVLEGLAGRGFAVCATDPQRARLERVYEKLAGAVQARRYDEILGIKEEFYAELLDGSGNAIVKEMLLQLNNRIKPLRATSLSDPTRPPKTVVEIRRVMDAIAARDPDAAWEACVEHVRRAAAVALAVLGVVDRQKPA